VAGRLLRWTVLQGETRSMTERTAAPATGRPWRDRPWGRIGAVAIFAVGGWALAGWQYFVALPQAANTARVAYALDLVDRFDDTPAHLAYVQLAADMKPWWDSIEDLQRRIQAAESDDARDALIAERDASLIGFVQEHRLADKVDLLIASFDTFTRCIAAEACDGEIVQKAISIDVKRIYRTFRPYILNRRGDGKAEDKDFGRPLEELYFRFVG